MLKSMFSFVKIIFGFYKDSIVIAKKNMLVLLKAWKRQKYDR